MPPFDADSFVCGRSITLDVLLVNCDAWSGMKRGTLMIDTTHCLSFSSGSHFEERISRRPIQSQPPPLSTPGTRMDEEGWGVIVMHKNGWRGPSNS